MRICKVVLILALAVILTGCMLSTNNGPRTLQSRSTQQAGGITDPNSIMWRFSAGFMTPADLPAGWSHRRDADRNNLGGVGRLVIYFGDDPDRQPLVRVNQTIVIYAGEAEAKAAFQTEAEQEFPPKYANDWKRPPELRAPRQADAAELRCLPLSVNDQPAQMCVLLARYGDMLTVLSAPIFEDRWITMPQFAQLVDRIDEHMQSARMP
jgi:hypothetical protein